MKRNLFMAIIFVLLLFTGPGKTRSAQGDGYLLNMYHFNIQYVVGSKASMRRIVKQSFEPLVDFYLDHPGWGADFEMQGMMIEYMAENYPKVLEKFKRLVNSGQAELVTFHYGDQLLLAFPRHDQEWSLTINDKLLDKNGIKRSGVIFTQEAQFGEGFCVVGKERGYHVAVMTTSQYRWFQDDDRFPYFTVNGMDVLTNKQATEPGSGIRVKWHFVGDGELVATAGISPYFPGLFKKNPLKLAALEAQLEAAEKDGYKIATVTEYVQALRKAGAKPQPLGAILDSPWRPNDGSGVFQWMGKYVASWEKDYSMRTQNWQVRNQLVVAERRGASPLTLECAWSHMVNAEVSDPSGWYPLPVEVNWDFEQMDAAINVLASDKNVSMSDIEEFAGIRPHTGMEPDEAPFPIKIFGAASKAEYKWKRIDFPGGYELSVSWKGKGDGGVAFKMGQEAIEYSPAMMEDTLRKISFKEIKGNNIHVALTNGLIGLGNENYLVRDNAVGYVAAGLDFENREIVFEVKNGKEKNYQFRFYALMGVSPQKAIEFANKINMTSP